MGIEIPESLQWVAKWIVGAGDWPEGDETAMWRVSDAWSAMSSALNEIDDEAAHAVGQALAAIDGETHEAIAAYWDRLTGQKGAWTSLVKYLDSLADQIGDGAADIEQTKLVIIGTMVIFAIEMAPLLATAWTGISAAGAVALRVATQITIRMAIKQLIARMLTRAAAKAAARAALHGAIFEAIEEGGLEIGTKILQVGIGHRDEITMQDVKDAGVAAAAGAAGGAVGAGLGNGGLLSGAADVASSRLGRATVAATTEATTGIAGEIAGAATAAALTDQPFNLTLDSITSSAAQGVPAGVHAAGNHHSDTDAPTLDPSVEDLGNTPPAPGTLQSEGTQPAGNDTGVPAEPSETQGAPASDSTTPAAADTTSPTNSIDTNQAPAPDHNESTSAASSTAPSENAGTRTDPTTPAISGADTPTASATNGPLSQNLSVTDGVAPDRSDITADNPVGQQDSSPPTPSTGAGPDTAASEISSTADSPQAPTTEHPAATQQPAVATPDSLAGQQVSAQSPQPSAADSLVGQPTQATTSPTDNVAAPATLGTSPDRLESSTTTLPLSDTAASAPNQVESSTNATAPGSTTTASAPTLSPPPASTHAPAADAGQRAAAPTTDAASPTQSANPAQTSNPTQPPATSAPVAAGPAPGSRAVATPLGPTTAGPANPVSDPARSPSTTQAPLSSEAARAPEPARAQANPAPPDSARATTPTTADPTRAPNSPAATPSTQRPPAVEQDAHAHANVDHNWSTDIPPRTGERYDTLWGAEEGIADLLRPDQGQSDRGGVPIQGDEGQPRSEPDHRQDGRHRPDGPTGGRDFPLRRGADADQSQTREDLAAERRDRLVDPRVNVTTPTDTESTSAPLPPHSTTPRAATPDLPSTALAQPRSVPDRSAPDVPHYTEPSVSSLPPGYSHLDPDFHQRQSRLPDWWPREGAPTGTPQPSDTRAQRDSEPGTHPDHPRRSPVVDNFIARAPESLPPSRRPGPETPPSQPPAQAHRPPNPAQNQQDQARAAREFFRNQRPDSDRVTEVNPARHPFSANAPSFDVRRYADRGISVISVRVHLTPGPYASPLEIRNLMESAQAATDQAFNTAPRLLNGDRLLVDLVFTTDPSTAHLRATVTQAPGDLSNWSVHARPETLANNIRQQLGLLSNGPGTQPGLTATDLRQISNDIAAAHTPSSFTDLPGTRVIDHHRLRDLEDDAYQAAVEDSLRDGDRFTQGADPRTHPYGQLINDGGPTRPGRGNNCLDNALAALSSFFGRPQVALPRWLDRLPNGTLDLRSGERGGVERAANWLGSGLTGYNNRGLTVSEQFDSVHNWIAHLGPGSAALVVNEWAARDRNGELRYDRNGDPLAAGSHATVIVYPPSAAGPLWWCPQSGAISDHPPAWMVDDSSGVWFTPIPPDRGVRNAGAVSNQRPSGAIPGTDLRPRSGAPTLPVRERLGGASDLDRRGDSGGTRTRADETGDRFRDRISNRVPELVGQDGDGQLHRGEADRSTADGRTNLSAPVGSDLRTDTGRPDRTGVPGPSIVHNRATHPSPPDHRQADTPFTNEHPSDPPRVRTDNSLGAREPESGRYVAPTRDVHLLDSAHATDQPIAPSLAPDSLPDDPGGRRDRSGRSIETGGRQYPPYIDPTAHNRPDTPHVERADDPNAANRFAEENRIAHPTPDDRPAPRETPTVSDPESLRRGEEAFRHADPHTRNDRPLQYPIAHATDPESLRRGEEAFRHADPHTRNERPAEHPIPGREDSHRPENSDVTPTQSNSEQPRPGPWVDQDGREHWPRDAPGTWRDANGQVRDLRGQFTSDPYRRTEVDLRAVLGESRSHELSANALDRHQEMAVEREHARELRDRLLQARDALAAELGVTAKDLNSQNRLATIERLRLLALTMGDNERVIQIDTLDRLAFETSRAIWAVVDRSEQAGMNGARDILPEHALILTGLAEAGPGKANTLDLVVLIPAGPEQDPYLLVLEAKGFGSTLGSRMVDELRVEQGTREYLDWMLKNDQALLQARQELERTDPELARVVENAIASGHVNYQLVHVELDRVTVTEFNIDVRTRILEPDRALEQAREQLRDQARVFLRQAETRFVEALERQIEQIDRQPIRADERAPQPTHRADDRRREREEELARRREAAEQLRERAEHYRETLRNLAAGDVERVAAVAQYYSGSANARLVAEPPGHEPQIGRPSAPPVVCIEVSRGADLEPLRVPFDSQIRRDTRIAIGMWQGLDPTTLDLVRVTDESNATPGNALSLAELRAQEAAERLRAREREERGRGLERER